VPGRSAGWGTLVQLTVAFEVPHNVRFGYLKECPAIGQICGGRAPVPGRLADGGGAAGGLLHRARRPAGACVLLKRATTKSRWCMHAE